MLVVGLVLNATLDWSWADPIAAPAIAGIAVKEGRDAGQGKGCCAPTTAATPLPLPSSWLRNGASGLRVRHDFPLLLLMIRGVVSPGPEASTDR